MKRLAALAAAVLTGTLLAVPGPASAEPSATQLNMDLTGSYSASTGQRGTVVGVAAATSDLGAGDNYGFDFAAGCSLPGSTAGCGAYTLRYRWDLGDGRTVTTSSGSLSDVAYTTPGVYTVRVTADNAADVSAATSAAGTATATVYVSPRYADVKDTSPTAGALTDAEAAWTAGALGLLPACDVDRAGNGQAEFCLTPSGSGAGTFTYSVNGTSTSCFADAWACRLPQQVFTDYATEDARKNRLISLDLINPDGTVSYSPTVCEDSLVAASDADGRAVGVEAGCVSYDDLLAALATALDSGDPGDGQAASCAGYSAGANRGAWLLGQTCVSVPDRAATKGETYRMLAKATGAASTGTPAVVLDDAAADQPAADAANALLNSGVPLVGTLSCGDGTGVCLNSGQALHRGDLARMLAPLVHAGTPHAANLRVQPRPVDARTTLGKPVSISVDVHAPTWYPATAEVTLTPAIDGDGAGDLSCGPQASVTRTVGTGGTAPFTCTFTPTAAGLGSTVTLSLTASSTQDGATPAVGYVTVTVDNEPPRLSTRQTLTPADPKEGDPVTVAVDHFDPENQDVTVTVRSAETDRTGTTSFPLNGHKSPTLDWSQVAQTALGEVSVDAVTGTGLSVGFSPYHQDNYGPVAFEVRACDSGGSCSDRSVTFDVDPVNDRPSPRSLLTAQTGPSGTWVTLSGSDSRDAGRAGYATGAWQWRVCDVPAGWTMTWADGAQAVSGSVSDDPQLFVTPPASAALGDIGTFTFQVRDGGHPAPGVWSASGCSSTAGNGTGQGEVTVTSVSEPALAVGFGTATDDVKAYVDTVAVNVTGASENKQVTVHWGDGTSTGPTTGTRVTHTYGNPTAADGNGDGSLDAFRDYTATYTVTDATGATTAPQPLTGSTLGSGLVRVHANHADNPTAEHDATVWDPSAQVAYSSTAHAGARAWQWNVASASTTCTFTTAAPFSVRTVDGAAYRLRLWLQVPSTASVTLRAIESDARGTSGNQTATTISGVAAGAWQPLQITHTATADRQRLSLQVSVTLAAQVAAGSWCALADDVFVGGVGDKTDSAYENAVLGQGPWAYYPVDGLSSGVVPDVSGNNRDIASANVATATWKRTPLPTSGSRWAVTLGNGSSVGQMVAANGVADQVGDQWTAEMWFNTAGNATLVDYNSPVGGVGYRFRLRTVSGALVADAFVAGAAAQQWTGCTFTGAAHVAVVFTRSTTPTTPVMYVNGAACTLTPAASSLTGRAGTDLIVGGTTAAVTFDEVALYDHALPAYAAAQHHAIGTSNVALATVLGDSPTYAFSGTAARAVDAATMRRADRSVADGSFSAQAWLPRRLAGPVTWLDTGEVSAAVDPDSDTLTVTSGAQRWTAPLPGVGDRRTQLVLTVEDGSRPLLVVNGAAAALDLAGDPRRIAESGAEEGVAGRTRVRSDVELLTRNGRVWLFDDPLPQDRSQDHFTAWWSQRTAPGR